MLSVEDISHLLARQIGCFPSVERVILFGSRARGDADATSDIDLAVECPQADYPEWVMIRAMAKPPYTCRKIDLVRFERTPERLRENIERDGKVLYEKT
jgi:predicted nucleotidyltransferase